MKAIALHAYSQRLASKVHSLKRRAAFPLAAALLCMAPVSAFAAIRTVSNLDDSGEGSLRDTIASAASGDTIRFGLTGAITLTSGALVIDKNLAIEGPGDPAAVIVQRSSQFIAPRYCLFLVESGTVVLSGLTLLKGAADLANYGGAIRSTTTLTVSNCVFRDCLSFDQGGAIWSSGRLTVENCTFQQNKAEGTGGAIYHSDNIPLTVSNCIFTSNNSMFGGGAIRVRHSGGVDGGVILKLFRSTFTGNLAGTGGAVDVSSSQTTSAGVLVEDCTFRSNTGLSSGLGSGGALYFFDGGAEPHVVRRCVLDGNLSRFGGAIHSYANLMLDNCTVLRNSSTYSGSGFGGILYASGGRAMVRSCTFTSNRPGTGNADIQQGADAVVEIANTILDRGAGQNLRVAGSNPALITSLGYNLCSDDGGGFLTATGDQINTPAGLDPLGLQPNGGLTHTIALMVGSPALDRGFSFGLTTDQRGQPRPRDLLFYPVAPGGDDSDIGAFESTDPIQSSPIIVNTLHDHHDGIAGAADCTLREAIARASALGTNTVIGFDPGLNGTIMLDRALGPLNITGSLAVNGPGGRILAVSADSYMRVLTCTSTNPSTISGLTLRDGFHGFGLLPGETGFGGGILNAGTLTLTDCTLDDHYAKGEQGPGIGGNGGAGRGGGIYNNGVLTLNRCTLRNCIAAGGGGTPNPNPFAAGGSGGVAEGAAIYNAAGRSLTISQCTFAQNEASGGHGGDAHFAGNGGNASGAIFNAGVMTITSATVSTNKGLGGLGGKGSNLFNDGVPGAGIGGMVNGAGGGGTIRGTLCGGNTARNNAPSDVNGAFLSGGYNLIGTVDGSSGFNATGDQTGSHAVPLHARLTPLGNNGGPTDTMMPGADSSVIDKGKAFGGPVDQRGVPRTSDIPTVPNAIGGDGTDVGAVEFTGYLIVTTLDDHDDGTATASDTTLREAILAAISQPGTEVISFLPELTGTIQLMSALPNLSSDMFIEGPGAGLLTVRRNSGDTYRIFTVTSGSSVTISGLAVMNGDAGSGPFPSSSGGGILNDQSQLTLRACRIIGNNAVSGFTYGGGVFNHEGTLVIESCTFSGNNAYYGGGLANNCTDTGSATASVTGSTFAGNSAPGGYGGAVFNSAVGFANAPLTLVNCTLSGNSAAGGFGGGIYSSAANTGVGSLTLTHCTLSDNSAPSGGGIYNFNFNGSAMTVLRNNILNTGDSGLNLVNSGGTIDSQGYNLSNDAAGGDAGTAPGALLDATGDVRNTDPLLGVLAGNGGLTQTHQLLRNSPAIDRGNSFGVAVDQRGLARVANATHLPNAPGGDGADIGALEISPLGSAADTDGDAMSDEWEIFYGVDDPNADPDNDGDTNLEESLAGTNPRDSSSFLLRIISIEHSGNNVVITFNGVAGKTFRLERKDELSDPTWLGIAGLADVTPQTTGTVQFTHANGLSIGRSFYIVRLLQ